MLNHKDKQVSDKQVSDKQVSDKQYIELKERCVSQMQIEVCNGCDACGLRCAAGVPATRQEWEEIQAHIQGLALAEQEYIARVERQDKTVDLGDEVTVQMCRYRDMERGRCVVYAARPLVCRLLGHVEWMPCPIEKVPRSIPTADALTLMSSYATFERHTFEEWEEYDSLEKTFGPEEQGLDDQRDDKISSC